MIVTVAPGKSRSAKKHWLERQISGVTQGEMRRAKAQAAQDAALNARIAVRPFSMPITPAYRRAKSAPVAPVVTTRIAFLPACRACPDVVCDPRSHDVSTRRLIDTRASEAPRILPDPDTEKVGLEAVQDPLPPSTPLRRDPRAGQPLSASEKRVKRVGFWRLPPVPDSK